MVVAFLFFRKTWFATVASKSITRALVLIALHKMEKLPLAGCLLTEELPIFTMHAAGEMQVCPQIGRGTRQLTVEKAIRVFIVLPTLVIVSICKLN